MARDAVLISRIRHRVSRRRCRHTLPRRTERSNSVVTLQAERKDRRPFQQPRVGGTVRHMTRLTAIDPQREMLEGERTALAGVALQAGFLVDETLVHLLRPRSHTPRRSERSMRIVAVRALHESFVHPMLGRHRKLGSDVGVTPVAELRLGLGEKQLRCRGFMNRMATGAGYFARRMRRAADVGAGNLLRMTRQARVQRLLRR